MTSSKTDSILPHIEPYVGRADALWIDVGMILAAAFSRSRDLIQRLLLSASDIYEQSLYLKDLFVADLV